MRANLNEPEERENLFCLLQQLFNTYSQQSNSLMVFDELFKLWKNVGVPLFEWGYWSDFEKCGKVVFNYAKTVNNIPAQAQVLNELGWVYMEWENFVFAQKYFDDSLQLYKSINDDKGQCKMWRYLGVLSHRQNQFNLALDYYLKAWRIVDTKIYEASTDRTWAFQEAELHNIFGETYLELQEFQRSYISLSKSIDQYKKLIDFDSKTYQYYLTDPLINLGRWYFFNDNYLYAKDYFYQCIQLSKDINRPDTEAKALFCLAELSNAEGDYNNAINLLSDAEKISGIDIRNIRELAAKLKENLQDKKSLLIG